MYCKQCGKQISDQAKFCNFCGAKVTAEQPKPAPQPQPKPAAAAQPAQQTEAPKKKKGKVGIIILIIIVALGFLGRYAEDHLQNGGSLSDMFSSKEELPDLMAPSNYGALFEGGYLTYGLARVQLPGYSLLEYDGSGNDYLISSDESTIFYVNKPLELNISYEASDEAGMLKSFTDDSSYTNVSMVHYKKYEVAGYKVINYIVSATEDGVSAYMGELIFFCDKNPSHTMRMSMYTVSDYSAIDQVFDTLSISADYEYGMEDTDHLSSGRIAVR